MSHHVARSLAVLTFLGCSLCAAAQDLPSDKAESISGKKMDFPAVLRGSIATCVFGFGNDSVDRVGVWLESLASDNINAWSVVNLETTPAGARGVLRMSMRVGTPKELLDRSLIISKDYKEWRRILEVQKESLPVLVLFDKAGKIAWKRQGTFSSSITDELKARIAELSGK